MSAFANPANPTIIAKLAKVVAHVAAKNQDVGLAQPSPFDAPVLPTISIEDYLERMRLYMHCSTEVFVIASVLITRLEERSGHRSLITPVTVHRLLLASAVVAAKMQDDVYMTNSHYAAVGGISLDEMNLLERHLVTALGFELVVTPEQFEFCTVSLESLHDMLTAPTAPQMVSSARRIRRSSSSMVDRMVDDVLEGHDLPHHPHHHHNAAGVSPLEHFAFGPVRERRGSSVIGVQ